MVNNTPFSNSFLLKDSNIGKYELYVDGSTGWGILFPNGYIEVEDGPHKSVSRMIAEINGISFIKRGYDVQTIPDGYWMGELSKKDLSMFFDNLINDFNKTNN